MNFYLHSSKVLKPIYPELTWNRESNGEKKVYLTFDDGPNPEATSFVLDVLKSYNFKATFFCIGDNVKKHASTYNRILEEGHRTGNHTFNHLNGFKTENNAYVANVRLAAEKIDSSLFRPPYGRLKKKQIDQIIPDYEIIMWSILSGDFDPKLKRDKAFSDIVKLTKNGSIIVFHDSLKALDNLHYLLPKYCEFLTQSGFTSCIL